MIGHEESVEGIGRRSKGDYTGASRVPKKRKGVRMRGESRTEQGMRHKQAETVSMVDQWGNENMKGGSLCR